MRASSSRCLSLNLVLRVGERLVEDHQVPTLELSVGQPLANHIIHVSILAKEKKRGGICFLVGASE